MVLESEDGLSVVAEAGDLDAALRATRDRSCVVVLDLYMPGEPTLPAILRSPDAARGEKLAVASRSAAVARRRARPDHGQRRCRAARFPVSLGLG